MILFFFSLRSSTDDPDLDAEDAKLLPFVAQRLVTEGHARRAVAPVQGVVEPQAVAAVAAANAEEVGLAEHEVLVDAAVGKRLEADRGRGRRVRRVRWRGRGFEGAVTVSGIRGGGRSG